jgi:DNA-binding MarR family transcriptional regulator
MKRLHNDVSTRRQPARADDAFERLFELAARLGDVMGRGLAERGMSIARAELVWVLRRQGATTQRELAETLRCTPRNVTGLVDALQAAGLVERRPHPTDRRAILVSLTDTGTAIANDWHADFQRGGARLFRGVSAADLATFLAPRATRRRPGRRGRRRS